MSCGRPSGGVSATAAPAAVAASTAAQQQLRHAAFAGDAATCRRLLAGARCVRFSRDQRGRSALHLAAAAGRATVVRLLLAVAAPGEADAPDGDGCAPLQTAAADGHEEVVRLLLARGADVDGCDSVHNNTALHEAAWKGYSRTVRLLAAAGANLTKANAGGFTALHLCCQNGHNQCCRELLLAGCDPDVQNNYGDTALHTAARYGHAGVTRILISGQCRVSEQNKNGDTALHIAAAMGRRKLTRILLEAGCDKCVRNKQGENARDIALRKELTEIVDIVDDCAARREKKANKQRKRSKSKVRFEGKHAKDTVDNLEKTKHWSPYGCHYYPDPEAFPSPRLDSLPQEPLKKGEQYYLDLAGNICKGPVGVGYTCYCAPLFRHLEARLERDKRELQRAQLRLGQRVAGLEQRLERGRAGRRSERPAGRRERGEVEAGGGITRSRSLEMLDQEGHDAEVAAAAAGRSMMQATRSMDELENQDDDSQRPSVKELVARIQQQTSLHNSSGGAGNNSESSDDEDKPLRMSMKRGPMGDSNLAIAQTLPNYENVPSDAPRSRSGVYSPTIVNTALVDQCQQYIEPVVRVQEPGAYTQYQQPNTSKFDARYHQHNTRFVDPYREYYEESLVNTGGKYNEHNLSTKLAKLRVLENVKQSQIEAGPSTNHDNADRDTNNDSGYSTKVYGSSKGNSPSLSGQIDGGECLGASSLV